MIDDLLKSLYDAAPRPLQHIAVSAKGLQMVRRRRGGDFEELLEQAIERQSFSANQLQSYRKQQLGRFIETASHSPFWSERFDRYGVNPQGEDPFEQVSKLPILTKKELKDADRQICPTSVSDDNLLPCHTSGTTGSGLEFAQTPRALREQWAIWWRYRIWHGVDLATWHGYFGGIPIVPLNDSTPPFWRMNYPDKQVMFSTYHIKPENTSAYTEAIRERELPWLHGYPSALALLGALILDECIETPQSLRLVTIGAETLFDHQHEIISEAFGVPVRQHYGLEEAVANISECPDGNLHVDEDFSHVEFVPLEESDKHRIVGTNWTNPAFPLFRYDTGDLVILSDRDCSCGRHGRIVESILGRQDDYVLKPNGARVGRLDHIFKDIESVREAQIYQPERERIVVRVVPSEAFDDEVESELLEKARTRLGHEILIELERVEDIARTDNGKMKFVVSDVDGMQIETPSL